MAGDSCPIGHLSMGTWMIKCTRTGNRWRGGGAVQRRQPGFNYTMHAESLTQKSLRVKNVGNEKQQKTGGLVTWVKTQDTHLLWWRQSVLMQQSCLRFTFICNIRCYITGRWWAWGSAVVLQGGRA